jgi:hypothetical protein
MNHPFLLPDIHAAPRRKAHFHEALAGIPDAAAIMFQQKDPEQFGEESPLPIRIRGLFDLDQQPLAFEGVDLGAIEGRRMSLPPEVLADFRHVGVPDPILHGQHAKQIPILLQSLVAPDLGEQVLEHRLHPDHHRVEKSEHRRTAFSGIGFVLGNRPIRSFGPLPLEGQGAQEGGNHPRMVAHPIRHLFGQFGQPVQIREPAAAEVFDFGPGQSGQIEDVHLIDGAAKRLEISGPLVPKSVLFAQAFQNLEPIMDVPLGDAVMARAAADQGNAFLGAIEFHPFDGVLVLFDLVHRDFVEDFQRNPVDVIQKEDQAFPGLGPEAVQKIRQIVSLYLLSRLFLEIGKKAGMGGHEIFHHVQMDETDGGAYVFAPASLPRFEMMEKRGFPDSGKAQDIDAPAVGQIGRCDEIGLSFPAEFFGDERVVEEMARRCGRG